MSEIINTFLLDSPLEPVFMDRKDFYSEQVSEFKKNGSPTRAIEVVNILIFNSHGELIVQKRSFDKAHNAGLLDKSIGGHIQKGDTPNYTVMVETIQELQTPSIVLEDQEDFNKTFLLLGKYLETIAIVKHFKTALHSPVKVIDKELVEIANKMHIYFGVYDGRIRPVDREAKGVLFYSIDELKKEMSDNPQTFTGDMHLIMKEYGIEMQKFVDVIKSSK